MSIGDGVLSIALLTFAIDRAEWFHRRLTISLVLQENALPPADFNRMEIESICPDVDTVACGKWE